MTVSPTVGQAFTDWMLARSAGGSLSAHTVTAYRTDVEMVTGHVAAYLNRDGDPMQVVRLDDLTVRAMREGFARYAGTHARASIARAQSTWRGLMRFAVHEEWLPGDPMSGVEPAKVPRRGPKPLRGEADTAAALLGFLASSGREARNPWPERDLAVIATLLTTGMRSAEIRSLDIGDIYGTDGDRRFRVIGKGSKERTIPIERSLTHLIDAYTATRRTRFLGWKPTYADPLFVDTDNTRLSAGQLRWLVQTCLRAAGLGATVERGAMVHALRHTVGTMLASEGVPVTVIQELLGHESIATTQGYIRAVGREIRQGAAANPVYRVLPQR